MTIVGRWMTSSNLILGQNEDIRIGTIQNPYISLQRMQSVGEPTEHYLLQPFGSYGVGETKD